jgi:hypothetical protein
MRCFIPPISVQGPSRHHSRLAPHATYNLIHTDPSLSSISPSLQPAAQVNPKLYSLLCVSSLFCTHFSSSDHFSAVCIQPSPDQLSAIPIRSPSPSPELAKLPYAVCCRHCHMQQLCPVDGYTAPLCCCPAEPSFCIAKPPFCHISHINPHPLATRWSTRLTVRLGAPHLT